MTRLDFCSNAESYFAWLAPKPCKILHFNRADVVLLSLQCSLKITGVFASHGYLTPCGTTQLRVSAAKPSSSCQSQHASIVPAICYFPSDWQHSIFHFFAALHSGCMHIIWNQGVWLLSWPRRRPFSRHAHCVPPIPRPAWYTAFQPPSGFILPALASLELSLWTNCNITSSGRLVTEEENRAMLW